MKQLTCEMCGGTDLIKQDGVFVCQNCGTKYTVEEARKMMIEGTVNVQGNVKVQNAAQLENLLNLAHSSFDSKNFAQAEEFCNQVIAMDALNYEAWKLKGEAINYQIDAQNPRILEVFNCIMTSFKVLDDSGKQDHKDDILRSLKDCFEGEIHFWLEQFESGRPTDAALAKVKSSFLDSKSKMSQAFDELGFSEVKDDYISNFTNYFVEEANGRCVSAWKTTVGYNYYRDDFGNLGSRWVDDSSYITPNSDEFRPTKQIWDTFIGETSNLISLLEYAESLFDNKTTDTVKENIFNNIAYFSGRLINSCSYKIQVGLVSGWSWDQAAGWKADYYLNDSSISFWRNKKSTYERKKQDVKNTAERKKQEAQKKKNEEYWAAHADEKEKLETEKRDLQTKISRLESEKKELGLFKLKEKKVLQDQIDPMQSRLNAINTELTKNR